MSSNVIGREFSSTREFLSLGALRAMGIHSHNCREKPQDGLVACAKSGKPKKLISLMRSLFKVICSVPLLCSCPSMTSGEGASDLGSRVTGTLYGYRRGRAQFAVQEDPQSNPVLLVELAILTNSLVKEMASGMVKIALECERTSSNREMRVSLFEEPRWTMYYNGHKAGYAVRRSCSETDLKVFSMVQPVSMGAGVLPMADEEQGPDGELMFMRAVFHRVVGSTDSEVLYMMNPRGTGEPELSIFLLRI